MSFACRAGPSKRKFKIYFYLSNYQSNYLHLYQIFEFLFFLKEMFECLSNNFVDMLVPEQGRPRSKSGPVLKGPNYGLGDHCEMHGPVWKKPIFSLCYCLMGLRFLLGQISQWAQQCECQWTSGSLEIASISIRNFISNNYHGPLHVFQNS